LDTRQKPDRGLVHASKGANTNAVTCRWFQEVQFQFSGTSMVRCQVAYFLGIRLDPTIVIGALAAIIGGVVGFGSNSSTSKQTMAAMKAVEAQRAKLIGMIDLRPVGTRNGRQAIDS
jgi:hypothetical protein